MNFNFLIPNELIVKRGAAAEIGPVCAKYAKRIGLFHYGQHFCDAGIYDKIKTSLNSSGVECALFASAASEPSPDIMNSAAAFLKENNCDGVLAVGGGSVIDVAKAACALAPNGTDIMEYVEGFSPKKFENKPYPVIAMPTTAGTGSECTKNSVVTSKGNFKNSVRDDSMLPVASVLDAELMLSVPMEPSMHAGADCLCQLVEGYVTRRPNPLTDALLLRFSAHAYHALKEVHDNLQNIDARETMGLCATVSGIGISNAGLGAAHGLAAGLGALTPLSHGFICGVVSPHVIRFNIKKGVLKYADIAREIGGSYASDEVAACALADMVCAWNEYIGIPADFKGRGIEKGDIPAIAKACMGSSMKKNPVDVSLRECEELLFTLV